MNYTKTLISLVLASSLLACGGKTADEYLSAAKTKLGNDEVDEAVIDLKNAVKLQPENGNIRLILGDAYLASSKLNDAEKEYSKALKNGISESLIYPRLANVYSLKFDHGALLDMDTDSVELSNSSLSEVLFHKAIAAYRTKDNKRSRRLFTKSYEVEPEGRYGQLAKLYSVKNLKASLPGIAKLLSKHPQFFEGYYFQGLVSQQANETELAISSFETLKSLKPEYLTTNLYLANTYISDRQYNKAEKLIDAYLKVDSEQPFANQLKAQVLYQKGDYNLAQAHIDKALLQGLNADPNKLLAGLTSFQLQNYEQAYSHFSGVVDKLNSSHPAIRAYFETQLKLGYLEGAQTLLESKVHSHESHDEMAISLGYQLFGKGHVKDAMKLAQSIDPSDLEDASLAKLGLLKLNVNDMSGLDNLIKAKENNPNTIQYTQVVVATHLQQEEIEKAFKSVNEYILHNPKDPQGLILKSLVHLSQESFDDSIAVLKDALKLDDNNYTALYYLAKISMKNKQYDEAHTYIEQSINSNGSSLQILLLNYELASIQKDTADAVNKIAKAAEENNFSNVYLDAYINVLTTEQQYDKALSLLNSQSIDEKTRTPAQWKALVIAHHKMNNGTELLSTLKKWANTAKTNYRIWQLYVDALIDSNQIEEAIRALKTSIALTENEPSLTVKLANIHTARREIIQAKDLLDNLPDNWQDTQLVRLIYARIYINTGEMLKAEHILSELYIEKVNAQTATLYIISLVGQQKEGKVIQFARRHLEKMPNDINTRLILADTLMKSDPKQAIEQYSFIVEKSKANTTALNNLAYLLNQQGKSVRAKSIIEQALELQPLNPSLLDTAGAVYIELNNKERAIEVLTRALKIDPENKGYKKHLEMAKSL